MKDSQRPRSRHKSKCPLPARQPSGCGWFSLPHTPSPTHPRVASHNSRHSHRRHPISHRISGLAPQQFTSQALGFGPPGGRRGSGAVRNAGGGSRRGAPGAGKGWGLGEWASVCVLPSFLAGKVEDANQGILPGPSWCSGAATGKRAGLYPLLLRVAVRARICRLHFLLHSHSPQTCVFIPALRTHTGLRPSVFPPAKLGAPHHCGCCE